MDSQSNNVVVASPGGDGGLRAFVLAPTQRATKRTSEEITSSKITLTKKAKLSIEAAEETLVVEPAAAGEKDQVITASGPSDSRDEDQLTSISSLETSTNNLVEQEKEGEEEDYPDSATTTRSVEVPDNNSGPQSEEVTLDISGEASEVGDYSGASSGSDLESTEDEESPVFPDIDLDEDFDDDLEDDLEGEDEREEGPFSGPDYVIYSQSTSTSSQEDFSPELNSQDTTGYSLGDIEL